MVSLKEGNQDRFKLLVTRSKLLSDFVAFKESAANLCPALHGDLPFVFVPSAVSIIEFYHWLQSCQCSLYAVNILIGAL